ncbi:MAG: prolyl oligopeptidase family serine peptidase [Armatimonadota bacterium]
MTGSDARRWASLPIAVALLSIGMRTAGAQGSAEDYARSARLAAAARSAARPGDVQPQWIGNGPRFWYRNQRAEGTVWILVDPTTKTRKEFASRDALRRAVGADLAEATLPMRTVRPTVRDGGDESAIRFENRLSVPVTIEWFAGNGRWNAYGSIAPGGSRSQHTFAGHVWSAKAPDGRHIGYWQAIADPAVAVVAANGATSSEPEPEPAGKSRDGRWRVRTVDFNLVLVPSDGSSSPRTLTRDGTADDAYRVEDVWWSPDGKRLVAFRTEAAQKHPVHIVESSPSDQVQPRLKTLEYLKPGDRIARPRPVIVDIDSGAIRPVSENLFPNPWSLVRLGTDPWADGVTWSKDGRAFWFVHNERGHQRMRLLRVDAETAAVSIIVEETSPTFIDYADKFLARHLPAFDAILWMSERDGWNHLYLFDATTGGLRNRVTRGEWVVRDVERVDDATGTVWFRAMGIRPGQDPYQIHHARVGIDGENLTILTEGDGTHSVRWSPDGSVLVDTWSRVDFAPVVEVRDGRDGRRLLELERSVPPGGRSAAAPIPERFVAKGRDGRTEIWGVIHRPSNFDPKRRYPVVEQIYAGPQGYFVPKAWSNWHGNPQAIAELGFIVVQIDGMGTNWRSKAFHDVCARNLRDAGFPDRIAWMRAAAARRPWMDLTRVGIYGGSAGGQNALAALIWHGDFYKVAVADCGCHDNRMDKIWWNELWMGWPVGPAYADNSNVVHAGRVTGKLMLVVGELDDNVDPASTMQVASALVKADRDFDLLVIPGAGHGAAETPYGKRRRMDFLVRHLLAVEPRWGGAGSPTERKPR